MSIQPVDQLKEMAKQRGNPFRVLIVDDEKWVREVFRDFCELTEAFEVDLAQDGTDAIHKALTEPYDLVTLDLIMPDVSGLDVLEAIKKAVPQLPVIVITGNATEKLVNGAGVLGACRLMYKPVLLDDFVSELVSTLKQKARVEK